MKRKIIEIDTDKCDGCGLCVNGCAEGALKIINGKACLVNDIYCDGLGACIGECPQGALLIKEREASKYDEQKVREHLKEKKSEVEMQKGKTACGCPGSQSVDLSEENKSGQGSSGPSGALVNWPIQLHLVSPHAPYFENADLLIAADCSGFALSRFSSKFLQNKQLIIFCPKLDEGLDQYIEKLAEIFSSHKINSVSLVHMEVPCCFGLVKIAEDAVKKSGKNIILKEYTVSIRGEII